MFAPVRIAAIEIAAGHDTFALGQVHAALRATHHLFDRSRGILLPGRLFAVSPQQQEDHNDDGKQK